jgi:hypothetical protein
MNQTADITPLDDLPPWQDRPSTTVTLHIATSSGPFEDAAGYETGQHCPGCDTRPAAGDEIIRFGSTWWHLTCARTLMRDGGANAAWMALGADLAARPSHYNVTETRAIVRNLLRLADQETTR